MSDDTRRELRNEAILLLGSFWVQDLKDKIGDGPQLYGEFLDAAADMWAKVRPHKGLQTVDAAHQRARYAFALEAWARKHLGLPPCHTAYLTDATKALYREMTGTEPDWHAEEVEQPDFSSNANWKRPTFPQGPWPKPDKPAEQPGFKPGPLPDVPDSFA